MNGISEKSVEMFATNRIASQVKGSSTKLRTMEIEKIMLMSASILTIGGTGSFGHTFVPFTLHKYGPHRLVILSHDAMKQWLTAKLASDKLTAVFLRPLWCEGWAGSHHAGAY